MYNTIFDLPDAFTENSYQNFRFQCYDAIEARKRTITVFVNGWFYYRQCILDIARSYYVKLKPTNEEVCYVLKLFSVNLVS